MTVAGHQYERDARDLVGDDLDEHLRQYLLTAMRCAKAVVGVALEQYEQVGRVDSGFEALAVIRGCAETTVARWDWPSAVPAGPARNEMLLDAFQEVA